MNDTIHTSNDIKISIIAYDGGFRERFFQIDSLSNQTLDNKYWEYIFVENFDQINPDLVDKFKKGDNAYINHKFISLDREKSYNLSCCVNEGVRQSEGDLITVLDADIFLEPNVLERVLEYHRDNKDSVYYVHRFDEPQPPILRNQDITLDKLKNRCELLNDSNYGAFFSLSKENYLKVGGYEEHPVFSGPNHAGGMDLRVRFENMGLNCEWADDLKTYHICHENAFGNNRWNGLRVETQWKIIDHRRENDIYHPYIGISDTLSGVKRPVEFSQPSGEWYEEWLGNFDDKSIGYQPV